jgi:hypothetical protein
MFFFEKFNDFVDRRDRRDRMSLETNGGPIPARIRNPSWPKSEGGKQPFGESALT